MALQPAEASELKIETDQNRAVEEGFLANKSMKIRCLKRVGKLRTFIANKTKVVDLVVLSDQM